jgi:transcription initiation factor TFIID subunit 5
VWACAFAPLGHYFASASADRTARLWCTERGRPLRLLAGHHSDVSVLAWHPNSHYLATGSDDRTLRLWDVRDGKPCRVLVGHRAPVRALLPWSHPEPCTK